MIIVCACAFNQLVSPESLREVVAAIAHSGKEFRVVDDLCRVAAEEKETLIAQSGCQVVACYPRAVKALFDRMGSEVGEVFNLRMEPAGEIVRQMGLVSVMGQDADIAIPSPQGEWVPWFPAIDRNKCTSCRKCMDFCLFGVYTWEEKQVRVSHPANCKNNCPACARVCPQTAIIFPKYPKSPVNGGLVNEEYTINLDMRELYKSDLYTKLAARNRNKNRLTD